MNNNMPHQNQKTKTQESTIDYYLLKIQVLPDSISFKHYSMLFVQNTIRQNIDFQQIIKELLDFQISILRYGSLRFRTSKSSYLWELKQGKFLLDIKLHVFKKVAIVE